MLRSFNAAHTKCESVFFTRAFIIILSIPPGVYCTVVLIHDVRARNYKSTKEISPLLVTL